MLSKGHHTPAVFPPKETTGVLFPGEAAAALRLCLVQNSAHVGQVLQSRKRKFWTSLCRVRAAAILWGGSDWNQLKSWLSTSRIPANIPDRMGGH